MTPTISQLKSVLHQRIHTDNVVNQLLCYVLNCSTEHLYTHPEQEIDSDTKKEINRLSELIVDGMPLEYITGHCHFFSLQLKVSTATLIPRPETELLVEFALENIPQHGHVLELGTGCGAIAVALSKNRPDLTISATDISQDALKVAADNAALHRLPQINFIHSDWFQALIPQRFEGIISNPPYVAYHDPDLDAQVAHYEPQQALFAGETGLEQLQLIINQASTYLKDGGFLAVEHGAHQQEAVIKALQKAHFKEICGLKDYAQLPRIGIGHRADTRECRS